MHVVVRLDGSIAWIGLDWMTDCEGAIGVLISHVTLAATCRGVGSMVKHTNAGASSLDRAYIGYQDVLQR